MAPLHTTGLAALVLVALGGPAEATHGVDRRYVLPG